MAEQLGTGLLPFYTDESRQSRQRSVNAEPQVTCIILNWNGWRDTIECLDALKRCTYAQLSIIVVDNGSTDDSVARIRAAHPEIVILESRSNIGFAGGNNIGIRHALAHGAEYVWLLNNDTKPDPDALSALIAKAASDKRIGAVASICYYADEPSKVEAWGGAHVNLWIGYGRNSRQPREDNWFHALNGTSLLIASRALADAGLLDEVFFLYWEDTEFCLRLRKKGWRIAAAAGSHILHKVNASTGGNRVVLDRHQTASGLRLLRLHAPFPRLAMSLFLAIRLARRIVRFQFERCRSVVEGLREYRNKLSAPPKIS